MEYTTLRDTGVEVSEIGLGCMSFGTGQFDWSLKEEPSREILERAIDLGINFFDTANIYSYGESERIVGKVLEEYDRDWPVVATKVFFKTGKNNPNSGGLSRKTIEQELDNSLERLGLDTVDLYQMHRWDYNTPIEETLRALTDAVHRGKTRYIGASSMWSHQFAEALHTSDRLGLERFVTMQSHYNLVYREEEREMLKFCQKEGIGVIPWCPLAKGYLTRPHAEKTATKRGRTDDLLKERPYDEYGGREINERVQHLAEEEGATMAQISLAWLLHKNRVNTPIIGVTSVDHLEDAIEATNIDLKESDVEYLEESYEPSPIVGHK